MRSRWKLVGLESFQVRKSFLSKLNDEGSKSLKMFSKRAVIFSALASKKLNVYNGLKYSYLLLKEVMIGRNVGSFLLTKRITSGIHSKTKKNKRGKMKKKSK